MQAKGSRGGHRRSYPSVEFRQLAELVFAAWPGMFRAEARLRAAVKFAPLEHIECATLRIMIRMQGVEVQLPKNAAWGVITVPARFDPEITLVRVERMIRRQARELASPLEDKAQVVIDRIALARAEEDLQ